MAFNLKRFFRNMQFLQNHIANYGASFKAQKVMLPSLKCQISHFWSKFVSFTQLSRQQIQYSKLSLCHFLVYMVKYSHAENLKNLLSRPWGKCLTDRRWTDEQDWFYWTSTAMDRWTRLILLDTYRKDGSSIMLFGDSRIKFAQIMWLDCEPCGNNQYNKKECNQHSSVFR